MAMTLEQEVEFLSRKLKVLAGFMVISIKFPEIVKSMGAGNQMVLPGLEEFVVLISELAYSKVEILNELENLLEMLKEAQNLDVVNDVEKTVEVFVKFMKAMTRIQQLLND